MEAKAKLTKEMICEEARFILANVLAEGRYGKQNHLDDIRRICEGAVSLALDDYVAFLENYGYMTYDRRSDVLDVTPEGERVVAGEKTQDLMARVLQHFLQRPTAATGSSPSNSPSPGPAPPRKSRFLQAHSQAAVAAEDDDEPPTGGPERMARDDRGREILDRRYEKIERLGTGGIGTVWKARQINLDREVAVKEIRELFGFFVEEQRREIQRRFGEVVRAAARLSHPNIIPVLDVNTERDYPYVVMELAPHGNLRRIIQWAEEIPTSLAIKYFLQALHALRAAHDQNVMHRGVKPENILLDRYGNARLSDFGTARVVERDQAVIQQVYVGMGAVAYMAPELYMDPLGAGPQADLYALGIILYELLTRKIPGRRSPMPSDAVKGLPRAIDDIFDRMTRDSRDERYKSAVEVLDDFYKSSEIGAIAELKGSILFFKSPLETLKFKDHRSAAEPAEPAEPPTEQTRPAALTETAPAAESAPASASVADEPPTVPGSLPAPTGPSAPASSDVTVPGVEHPPAPGAAPTATPGEPSREGSGSRALGRRPYSFQQRLRDKDKE